MKTQTSSRKNEENSLQPESGDRIKENPHQGKSTNVKFRNLNQPDQSTEYKKQKKASQALKK